MTRQNSLISAQGKNYENATPLMKKQVSILGGNDREGGPALSRGLSAFVDYFQGESQQLRENRLSRWRPEDPLLLNGQTTQFGGEVEPKYLRQHTPL